MHRACCDAEFGRLRTGAAGRSVKCFFVQAKTLWCLGDWGAGQGSLETLVVLFCMHVRGRDRWCKIGSTWCRLYLVRALWDWSVGRYGRRVWKVEGEDTEKCTVDRRATEVEVAISYASGCSDSTATTHQQMLTYSDGSSLTQAHHSTFVWQEISTKEM